MWGTESLGSKNSLRIGGKAAIPIAKQLADALGAHRNAWGNSQSARSFKVELESP